MNFLKSKEDKENEQWVKTHKYMDENDSIEIEPGYFRNKHGAIRYRPSPGQQVQQAEATPNNKVVQIDHRARVITELQEIKEVLKAIYMQNIDVKIDEKQLEKINQMVEDGIFKTKEEAIVSAIKKIHPKRKAEIDTED